MSSIVERLSRCAAPLEYNNFMSPEDLRREYTIAGLTETDAGDDPFVLFGTWFHAAMSAHIHDPNAMTLATTSADGMPSARVVLLKQFDHQGFCFFTNYNSRKAQDLEFNPNCCLVFFWQTLERQIRIEGRAIRTSASESDHYFASRPRGSRLGALASPQSAVVASRVELDKRLIELEDQYPDDNIPRPEFWGGYRVVPRVFEFWQGRPNRLHDRLRFTREQDNSWRRERLGP